ncbi:hypothetical protein L7F22_015193 [Adiantum nelumboides]|nr:hypothetical protein [Adiantum nelumboides]
MRYYGPFEITERINDVSFLLKLPDTWKIHNAFHVRLLKPFKGDVPDDGEPDEQPEVEENEEIIVPKQILAHKDTKNKGVPQLASSGLQPRPMGSIPQAISANLPPRPVPQGGQAQVHAARAAPGQERSFPAQPPSAQPTQQKSKAPPLELELVNQLPADDQLTLQTKHQEAVDTEKKVFELEKQILDSKEKMGFYRSKMQEIVLFKTRCDNRLAEITERIGSDKREVGDLIPTFLKVALFASFSHGCLSCLRLNNTFEKLSWSFF